MPLAIPANPLQIADSFLLIIPTSNLLTVQIILLCHLTDRIEQSQESVQEDDLKEILEDAGTHAILLMLLMLLTISTLLDPSASLICVIILII
jgi:L-asparagine transporter-like permease